MADAASAKEALRSSSLIGAASLANVAIGLVRNKAAAVLLGPAGFGMIALYQSLIASISQIGGLGLANASVRQLAQTESESQKSLLIRAVVVGSCALAMVVVAATWAVQKVGLIDILPSGTTSVSVLLVGLAAALTIIATAQQHLLSGLRRIERLAVLNVAGAVFGTLVGVSSLVIFNVSGVFLYLIAGPAAALLVGVAVLRGVQPAQGSISLVEIMQELRPMLALGLPLMLGNLANPLGQLAVRGAVGGQLGNVELGYLGAASMVSVTGVGLILSAVAADYFPRISAAYPYPSLARGIAAQQMEIALLLAAPLFLGLQAASPWLLHLLYSGDFLPASHLLRLFVIGDMFKTLSWPLAYLLLASGKGRVFIVLEATTGAVLVAITVALLPRFGLEAAGLAYVATMLIYLGAQWRIARRLVGFSVSGRQLRLIGVIISSISIIAIAGWVNALLALALGLPAAIAASLLALLRFAHMTEADNRLGRAANALLRKIKI